MVSLIGGGQTIALDATPQEEHTNDFEVTDHPVELDGNSVALASITDHVRPKPRLIKLDGLIVDGPLGGAYQAGFAKQQYSLLAQLGASGTLFTVNAEQLTYDNMVIATLRQTRDKSNQDAVRLSLTMREIRTVTTQTATVTRKLNKAKSKDHGGTKAATPVNRSALKTGELKARAIGGVTRVLFGGG